MQVEVCIENWQEAELARRFECDRIEICSALDLGGLTPQYSLIQACAKISGIESYILIRPRSGNFVYSQTEIILMKEDIRIASEAGAQGVVFGCLNPKNEIDYPSCEFLLRFAKEFQLKTTFHRAIDFTSDYSKAIQSVIDLGFNRILTSGQKATAIDGLENIKSIQNKYSGQIEIIAGSGINEKNVLQFQEIRIDAVHFSIRQKSNISTGFSMGSNAQPNENKLNIIIQKIKNDENN
ncbi:MAG: copper homeostasis protein CutC [Bacteroidales bacterium]|jgi:copper homeostasis protein|nr:copper homeostasis protein CutC [Bacteroidales bacterium]